MRNPTKSTLIAVFLALVPVFAMAQSVSYTDVTVNGTTSTPTKPSFKSSGTGGVAFMGTGSGVGTTYSYASGWTGFVFDAGLSSVAIGTFYVGDLGGKASLGVGYNPATMGDYSAAFGYEASALGDYSIASGYYSIASGEVSFAAGDTSMAAGFGAAALNSSTAVGDFSTSLNESSVAGASSTAINTAVVAGNAAFGQGHSTVGGAYAAGFGETTVPSYASVAIGQFNNVNNISGGLVNGTSWVSTDPVLSVGIGANASARKDAFTIYKDGKIRMTKRQGDIPMGQFGNGGGD